MDGSLAGGAEGEEDRAFGLLQLQEPCGQGLDGGPVAERGQVGLIRHRILCDGLRLEELGIADAVDDLIHKGPSLILVVSGAILFQKG